MESIAPDDSTTHDNQPGFDVLNEPMRTNVINRLREMDLPIRESLTDLAYLASTFLHAPFAAVSLVDTERTYFLTTIGASVPGIATQESMCLDVVNTGANVLVPEMCHYARLGPSSALRSRGIRSYAGVPLI